MDIATYLRAHQYISYSIPFIGGLIVFLLKFHFKKEGSEFPNTLNGYSGVFFAIFAITSLMLVLLHISNDDIDAFTNKHFISLSFYLIIAGASCFYDSYKMPYENWQMTRVQYGTGMLGIVFIFLAGFFIYSNTSLGKAEKQTKPIDILNITKTNDFSAKSLLSDIFTFGENDTSFKYSSKEVNRFIYYKDSVKDNDSNGMVMIQVMPLIGWENNLKEYSDKCFELMKEGISTKYNDGTVSTLYTGITQHHVNDSTHFIENGVETFQLSATGQKLAEVDGQLTVKNVLIYHYLVSKSQKGVFVAGVATKDFDANLIEFKAFAHSIHLK